MSLEHEDPLYGSPNRPGPGFLTGLRHGLQDGASLSSTVRAGLVASLFKEQSPIFA